MKDVIREVAGSVGALDDESGMDAGVVNVISRWGSGKRVAARGVAMFLGVFTLINILGERVTAGFAANVWWIDVRYLPTGVGHLGLGAVAGALICVAVGWPETAWTRRLVLMILAGAMAAVSWS